GDIGKQTVSVDKALSLGEERSTKTRRNRTVRLLRPLASDLARLRLLSGRPADDALVFPAADGGTWTDTGYRNWRKRHVQAATEAAGLTRVRPYDPRNSFASLLLAEQTNTAEIAAQLGHSLQMLFSTYAHVIEELRGAGRISAEKEIAAARKAAKLGRDVAQKLPGK